MYCRIDTCNRPPSPEMGDLGICTHHAKKIYHHVSDLLASATLRQRESAAYAGRPASSSGAHPGFSDRQGVVYFARFGYLIKIGFTTNLNSRMRTLRPDELLATQPGTMQDEKRLHKRFRRLRERDEFFLPGPELTDYIESLGSDNVAAG